MLDTPAVAASIELFGDHDTQWVGVERLSSETLITRYELNTIATFEQTLSSALPDTPDEARRELSRRLQRHDYNESELRHAAEGLARAAGYSLKAYPAIVIDQRYVFYGLLDAPRAMHLYYNAKQARSTR